MTTLDDVMAEVYAMRHASPFTTKWPDYEDVSAAIEAYAAEQVAAEREACARVAEMACLVPPDGGSPTDGERLGCLEAAAAIRARAQEE